MVAIWVPNLRCLRVFEVEKILYMKKVATYLKLSRIHLLKKNKLVMLVRI